jgi:RNA polymerase sigma factor (sigma-70 family)
MHDNNEAEVWDAFRTGSVQSYEHIYNTYAKQMYQFCRHYTSNHEMVEDCIQELFTELWERRDHLGQTDSIRFYLLRSIKRKLFRRMQAENKRKKREIEKSMEGFKAIPHPENSILADVGEQQMLTDLLNAINSLPARQREVLYLRYYHGLNFDELSELMDIPKKTAYNIVFIATNALRKQLNTGTNLNLAYLLCVLIRSANY